MTKVPSKRDDQLRALRALLHDEHTSKVPTLKSDINVTPLVDVVLVLLIIFMVVTPMIASGVAVDLPRTTNHARKPDDGKDIIISVTQDKRLFVGANRVPRLEDLGNAVRTELRKFPDKSIFLKGDARVSYGTMRETMQVLHDADIENIVLGTEELNKIH